MHDTEPADSRIKLPHIGSYQILRPLGSGGMRSVYKAVPVQTGHEVTLKVLAPERVLSAFTLQRFLREVRSAEVLEDPSIVSIYDRGVDCGHPYLVLEYVDGTDLQAYVETHGPMSAAEAIRVVRHAASGVGHATSRGLVHRNIKPSNILRSHTGEIKITDLGLALQMESGDECVTHEGRTVGTVDFMAPEQASDSLAASPQSDLYSLGCTFSYLLTGVPPDPGGDIIDKAVRHAGLAPRDVRDLRPDVPEVLSRVMKRMMAKKPNDRFTSFDDLNAALDEIVLTPGQVAPPAVASAPQSSSDFDLTPLRLILSNTQTMDDHPVVHPLTSISQISSWTRWIWS